MESQEMISTYVSEIKKRYIRTPTEDRLIRILDILMERNLHTNTCVQGSACNCGLDIAITAVFSS